MVCEVLGDGRTGGPEETAGEHLHVLGLKHGFIVMADRSRKNPGFLWPVGIDPYIGFHFSGFL